MSPPILPNKTRPVTLNATWLVDGRDFYALLLKSRCAFHQKGHRRSRCAVVRGRASFRARRIHPPANTCRGTFWRTRASTLAATAGASTDASASHGRGPAQLSLSTRLSVFAGLCLSACIRISTPQSVCPWLPALPTDLLSLCLALPRVSPSLCPATGPWLPARGHRRTAAQSCSKWKVASGCSHHVRPPRNALLQSELQR
jgi:hypothetical protein